MIGNRTRPCDSRPFYEHRLPDASFVNRALARPERQVLSVLLAAHGRHHAQPPVVGHEKKNGIICEIIFFQIIHHIAQTLRSEEHTSELQSLMRISYAVFCLK